MKSDVRHVAVIGNYSPRQCGLATFTTDVAESVAAEYPATEVRAVAMTDTEEGYEYPSRVTFEIPDKNPKGYRNAADYLNLQNPEIVCLQHEFGIFGGDDGSYILPLLHQLKAPLVTTLHTVLKEPTEGQRRVFMEVVELSDRVVIMSERGREFLRDIYSIPDSKIDFIHHGIPDIGFIDPNFHKNSFGVEGKTVMLTFGLLSPNKGIEYVIEALPKIIEWHPDVVYIVLGATHPHLVRHEGEAYRRKLESLAESLGVAGNVLFVNRFVSLEELCAYIGAADVYVTPYLNEAQITSGTLAYAAGSGKAVISTPYWYAQELLAGDRGILVPFRDSEAISRQVVELLNDDAKRHAMRRNAYELGRNMTWPVVAREYMNSFRRALENRASRPRRLMPRQETIFSPGELPALKLDHLVRMTDTTGLLQHAKYSVPDYSEGYCTDDNARALILMTHLNELDYTMPGAPGTYEARYLAFLNHAFDEESGRFRNFMAYERHWLEDVGSEDSHGRAVWALGMVARRVRELGLGDLAAKLFQRAVPATLSFTSPRSWAFAVLGIRAYLRRYEGDRRVRNAGAMLAQRLYDQYTNTASAEWNWFEDYLTYSNARLPQALLAAGQLYKRDDLTQAGFASLRWLMQQQRMDGAPHFVPIGSDGFHVRNGQRARFDQQPVEAHGTVSACLEAYRLSGDSSWRKEARTAFDWFLGRNDLGMALYDDVTGGCYDGLHAHAVNQNQGAESTLAFLLSLAEMKLATAPQASMIQPGKDGRVPARETTPVKKPAHGGKGTAHNRFVETG